NILAKAFLRIWPLNHFGGLGSGPSLGTAPAAVQAAAGIPVLGVLTLERDRRRRRRDRQLETTQS
ncbi:MAG: hypothetical protein JOZ75_01365, partial [Candidatus Dormibacteraeota bacterium]|nr:hypothetical protein [Candidatus Dormibacteraeota bacterium]